MQGPACFLDRLGCHCPLHGAPGVHGAADTARNKQPGEEALCTPSNESIIVPHYSCEHASAEGTLPTDHPRQLLAVRQHRVPYLCGSVSSTLAVPLHPGRW